MASKKTKEPTLYNFFEHVRFSGPFNNDRVDDPSALDDGAVDVPSIHKMEYQTLTDEVEIIKRGGKSKGVVIWGEAGIGKSHLLARFGNWISKDQNGIYLFFHNMMTPPEEIPEYILKCAISYLTDDKLERLSGTPLYKLIDKLIIDAWKRHICKDGKKPKKIAQQELEKAYMKEVDELLGDSKQLIHRESNLQIYKVLFELYCSAYYYKRSRQKGGSEANKKKEEKARLARRWLSVDTLEAEEAAKLGIQIPSTQDENEETENARLQGGQQVESILIALASLAQRNNQPFVMVFDQVENMEPEQIHALSRFCHALIDHTPNLLTVTCGVQVSLLDFKKNLVIEPSSWARIAKDTIALRAINRAESVDLLTARINSFVTPFKSLSDVGARVAANRLFPLGDKWLEGKFGDNIDFRPRDIINWSRERWNENIREIKEHGGEKWLGEWKDVVGKRKGEQDAKITAKERAQLIDDKVDQKITEQENRRDLNRSSLPPDASNMCGLLQSLLAQCIEHNEYTLLSFNPMKRNRSPKPAYDIRAQEKRDDDGKIVTTGLTFISTGSAKSTAFALRRIVRDSNPPDHVLAVTEKRMPLKLGAKGREYLAELQERGEDAFGLRELSFEEYARLDALRAVIGNARSGDLEIADEQHPGVSVAEVIDSHHRCDRYRQHPLLREFLTEAMPIGPPEKEGPENKPAKEFIMAQLSLNMGMTTSELANRYRSKHKDEYLNDKNVKSVFVAVAKELHDDRKISAKPINDDLYLLLRA